MQLRNLDGGVALDAHHAVQVHQRHKRQLDALDIVRADLDRTPGAVHLSADGRSGSHGIGAWSYDAQLELAFIVRTVVRRAHRASRV